MKLLARCVLAVTLLGMIHGHATPTPPSSVFDLKDWKLTLPGPMEIKNLQDYSSKYFDLNAAGEMCFHLDASEKGTTPNTHFVRAELRHKPNWKATEHHTISAEFRVSSHLDPDKVTVVQIHGITHDNKDAPPLLRVAVDDGDLEAHIKTDLLGEKTDKILLIKNLGTNYATVDVTMDGGQLQIAANGSEKVRRDIPFWSYLNYFKAGCYPQSNQGTVEVSFRKLTTR